MITISNVKLSEKQIFITENSKYYTFLIDMMGNFSPEDLDFTIKKTFENYNPMITMENNQWSVKIEKKYSLGSLLKHFYLTVYNKWIYY